jgi:hypothetical protein
MVSAKEAVSSPPADALMTDDLDLPDNVSSSLSELDPEDVSDEDTTILYRHQIESQLQLDVDSEAETERLHKSPNKVEGQTEAISVNDEEAATEALLGLSHAVSAIDAQIDVTLEPPSSSLGPVDGSSPSIRSAASALGKRKRGSRAVSIFSDAPLDEPTPKRTLMERDDDQVDEDEVKGIVDDIDPSDLDDEKLDEAAMDVDLQDLNGDLEESNSEERAAPEPMTRAKRVGGRGRRKGRRDPVADIAETAAEASDTPLLDAEDAVEDEVEEEEEDQSQDEECEYNQTALNFLTCTSCKEKRSK